MFKFSKNDIMKKSKYILLLISAFACLSSCQNYEENISEVKEKVKKTLNDTLFSTEASYDPTLVYNKGALEIRVGTIDSCEYIIAQTGYDQGEYQ